MNDIDKMHVYVKLIGRMEATLQIADGVLGAEHDNSDARARARESIAKRQAEIDALFAPAGGQR